MKNIHIIGGGVIGLTCAWRLAQAGHTVTVLEKGLCGSGASTASLGALMPYSASRTDQWPSLQQKSLWQYPQFAAELVKATGIDIGYKKSGRLQPISSEHQLKNMKEGADAARASWPHGEGGQRVLTPQECRSIEPELEVTEFGALLCKATAFVDVPSLIAALKAACRREGVDVVENCEVDPIVAGSEPVSVLRTGHGPVKVENLLVCAGAWGAGLCHQAIPVKPLKGQALQIAHDSLVLKHLIRAGGLYIIPKGYGKFLVGASKEDVGFDASLSDEMKEQVFEKACRYIPALAEGKVEKHWCGFRPQSTQKEPFIGLVHNNVYAATGHGGIGICLAPITAQMVVEMFAEG